jgi:polyphosphate kinase
MEERDEHLFRNRELSFLEFNQRIVAEAADKTVPLVERLKFISIVSANLDEFFMIRVAGLKQQEKSAVLETSPDGLLAGQQLQLILRRVAEQIRDQENVFLSEIVPSLAKEGVHILALTQLRKSQRRQLAAVFDSQIFPLLTPLAVDTEHPFPFLKNRSLNLAVHLLPENSPKGSAPMLAIVQVPAMLDRFVNLDRDDAAPAVVFVEDLISENVDRLFPGMRIVKCVPFRVLRNWDLEVDEEAQEDLLYAVESELQRRWKLDAVQLSVGPGAPKKLVASLRKALELDPADVLHQRGPLALGDLIQLTVRFGRPGLRDQAFQAQMPPCFRENESVFSAIAKSDILLHHPYESYNPVVRLISEAAIDPNVLAIKQTLYRTNRNSPMVRALAEAAQNGKQVTALVELKARFDEEANVVWARELEEAGVHVFYGMIGLKTHCKVTLIMRRESDGIQRYVHLGTGNYNEQTAMIYSDLSFFTAREEVGSDVSSLFNLLTGYSQPPKWNKLIVAPLDLRKKLIKRIVKVQRSAEKGESAEIVFKSNALIDSEVIRSLYAASQAGAKVTLLIRGPCALKVGLKGFSEGIVVRNIVDRFLEHSRIFYFRLAERETVYITSTDIMPRNFDGRVEVMLPIEDEAIKRRIIDEILGAEMRDNCKAAQLLPDGRYERVENGLKSQRAQTVLLKAAAARAKA